MISVKLTHQSYAAKSMFKFFIIAVLVVILWSLGSALYYMSKSKGDPKKMARALTIRITLSAVLFLSIILAYFMGWIQPHDVEFLSTKE